MTTVDILFRYAAAPSEPTLRALAGVREVYGIRGLSLAVASRTLRVEYDATRLNAAAVAGLVRQAGLDIVEMMPLAASQPQAAPAA